MPRVEVYIITKEEGANLTKFDILGNYDNSDKDQLVSGFLAALNNFARDVDFPGGVSLIRCGSLEARYAIGEHVFTVLVIDYSMPLGPVAEPVLSGLAADVLVAFEKRYHADLVEGKKKRFYKSDVFVDFKESIQNIIEVYMHETFELYQKLLLIEAMYAKVPQKWCLPLLERVSEGENIIPDLATIPAQYQSQLKKAIEKVNYSAAPVWEIFQVPTTDFQPWST